MLVSLASWTSARQPCSCYWL